MSDNSPDNADRAAKATNAPAPPPVRSRFRDDGFPTRNDLRHWTRAERAIQDATDAVELAGASLALTDAVILLGKARDRVADHAEGRGNEPPAHRATSAPDRVTSEPIAPIAPPVRRVVDAFSASEARVWATTLLVRHNATERPTHCDDCGLRYPCDEAETAQQLLDALDALAAMQQERDEAVARACGLDAALDAAEETRP